MPHTVWNLGTQIGGNVRVQERQFVAGIEPAQGIVLGRSREPKPMLVIQDAWVEPVEVEPNQSSVDNRAKISLALGKDPLNTALLLPVAYVETNINRITAAGEYAIPLVWENLFRAQGTMWAASKVAIDIQESDFLTFDVDVHMDWGIGLVDWFTWFSSWNNLEVTPDGNLVDGERAYA